MGFFSVHEILGPFIKKPDLKSLCCNSTLSICCYLTHLVGDRVGFLEDDGWWFTLGRQDRVIFQVILLSLGDHHCQQTPSCWNGDAGVACPFASLSVCFHSCFSEQRRRVVVLAGQNHFILLLVQHLHQGSWKRSHHITIRSHHQRWNSSLLPVSTRFVSILPHTEYVNN